jgi:hypothetical protein
MNTTQPSILRRLNSALASHGLVANCVMALPTDGINFSRVSATPADLVRSYGLVTERLGSQGLAIPRKYVVSDGRIVNYSTGPGYAGDDTNTNPSGMGLVLSAEHARAKVGLGVTFADAPAAVVVHAPTGLTAAVSGIWHLLAQGTVDQTISLLRSQVQDLGMRFDVADLWVVLSPGARHGFLIDERGLDMLRPLGSDLLVGTTVRASGNQDRPYSLDLSLLFVKLWEAAGVPELQIDFDERNTLTERDGAGRLVLPSKRAKDELGAAYASGILAIVVGPRV